MDNVVHLAPLIHDLAIILGIGAIVTFLFRRIKQPVVLGYIVAGVIAGPFTPELVSVTDRHSLEVWAELGVIFLMFSLGLEFSFRKLAQVGSSAAVTAVIQVVMMIFVGYGFGRLVQWPSMDSIFLGCMIAISSTTIIIKAFEELGLKNRKFAQTVFGILIVEDLAAILILVALSNFVSQANVSTMDLVVAAAKLGLVVGIWFMVGMFVVPTLVKALKKYGDDEMLTVAAIGLCLALGTISATLGYSVALGAFMMGSILAETTEAERIEHLVRPLKDIFGAVFFVSVGMLMDPKVLTEHAGPVLGVTLIIIFGKVLAITLGSLLTGQSLENAIKTGFSMAQIGEFSFIIATLGLSFKAISPTLYPIIVAASLITTFTTPYLMKAGPLVISLIQRTSPRWFLDGLNSYASTIQKRQSKSDSGRALTGVGAKWVANALIVVVIYFGTKERIYPFIRDHITRPELADGLSWAIAFLLSSPFMWGMIQAFRTFRSRREGEKGFNELYTSLVSYGGQVATALLAGLLSLDFISPWISLCLTVIAIGLQSLFFKKNYDSFYSWFEQRFQAGFQAQAAENQQKEEYSRLAPWDGHLFQLTVHPDSTYAGKKLIEMGLRERLGINLLVIQRGSKTIVAPQGTQVIFPNDKLLFLGTDEGLEELRRDMETPQTFEESQELKDFSLFQVMVPAASPFEGKTIRESKIREEHQGIVVGVERGGHRSFNPKSDVCLKEGDLIWVVGPAQSLKKLADHFDAPMDSSIQSDLGGTL